MIRYNIRFFVVGLLMVLSQQIIAQNEAFERRLCLSKVYDVLEDYEYYNILDDEDMRDGFLSLFTNGDVSVYNDLLGLSLESTIRVKDYIQLQSSKVVTPVVTIKNIKNRSIEKHEDGWRIVCEFDKEIRYKDRCGIMLSSSAYYNDDYHMTAYMRYDAETDVCKIERIDGNIAGTRLPTSYSALQKTDERDIDLKYRGKPVKFNIFNQVLFPEVVTSKTLTYADADVSSTLIKDKDCNLVTVKYKPTRWRVRPHFDMTIGDYYKISSSVDQISSTFSGSEFGVDVGYTIPSKSKVKFSVNLGVAYAMSKINLDMPAFNYNYNAGGDADIDGDSYLRFYEVGPVSEKLKMDFLSIPVYFDVDFCFSKYITLYLQAGIKNYMNISAKVDQYSVSNNVYGIYPQYDNLRMDGSWGYNSFGAHEYTSSDLNDNEVPVKGFSMDFFGGAGIRIKPIKSFPMAIEVGIQYQTAAVGMWNSDSYGISTTGNVNPEHSLFSYTVENGEKIKSLDNGLTDVKRQHLKLNVGLVFKF